ncbi:MAG: hypothetical protein E7554_02580 [Ruminococcaceae bacterium]|nr:hypothetical protein [Oscillospiraceae bacterium]
MKKEIMAKVCPKCGIVNSEKAEDCEACGTGLGAAVTSRQANKLSRQISKKNEKLRKAIADEKHSVPAEEPIDIPVTPTRIVIGVIGCLAMLCEVVLMVFSYRLFPEDFTYEMFMLGFCALILLIIGVLHCFIPGMMWSIEHCFDKIYYKEMPRPSDTGLKLLTFSSALLVLLGIASVGFQIAVICGLL